MSLEAMHGTTTSEDLFESLVLSMTKLELAFENSIGFAIDGVPAMVLSQKKE